MNTNDLIRKIELMGGIAIPGSTMFYGEIEDMPDSDQELVKQALEAKGFVVNGSSIIVPEDRGIK